MTAIQMALLGGALSGPPPGQQAYTTAGTFTWVAPADVTSVCVVCVGGAAGRRGYGAGLGWKNNISVVPGQSYTVRVGQGKNGFVGGGDGTDSFFIDVTTVAGKGSGRSAVGEFVGDGGGNGGLSSGGGGGAGGYTGNGGAGSNRTTGTAIPGGTGSGGGGGGGSGGLNTYIEPNDRYQGGGGGGGVGILGQGANGSDGGGGSGGASGVLGTFFNGGSGGSFGGGGGENGYIMGDTGSYSEGFGGDGAGGAVRIIWGAGRSFPSTNTGNL
jgi:hypothetical protein